MHIGTIVPLVVALAAGVATAATDGTVVWHLTTDTPVIDINSPTRVVNWYSSVEVTGNNQGLAGFYYTLDIRDSTNAVVRINIDPASWQTPFAVAGPAGKPTTGSRLIDVGSAGGPGMNAMPSTGSNDTLGGLSQCGTAHLGWDPWRLNPSPTNPTRWTGSATAGVGRADRRSALLLDPNGTYGIQSGSINVEALGKGTYTVRLYPESAQVLREDVDLSQPQSSISWPVPAANLVGDAFEFTISDVVNHPPQATAAAQPLSGRAPLMVAFSASGSTDPDGDPLTYAWSFGDSTNGTGLTKTHTYTTPGTFTVTLTVSDGKGGTDTKTLTITANANKAPTAVISANPTSGEPPLTVSFSAAGSTDGDGDALSYAWEFGDGGTAQGQTVSHTFNDAGTFQAKVTVSDGHGGSDSKTITITVESPAPPIPVPTGGCGAAVAESLLACAFGLLLLQRGRRNP